MAKPWEQYQQAAPQPAQAAPAGPWAQYAGQEITDLETVSVRPDFADQAFNLPKKPDKNLLEYVRTMRPQLREMDDQRLATAIRREGYAGMDPMEFYRETGLGEKFGMDMSVPKATDGMSGGQRILAGIGAAMDSTGRGVKQRVTEIIGRGLPGLLPVEEAQTAILERADESLSGQESVNAERKELNQPLMDTRGGFWGNVGGHVMQVVGPGVALKASGKVPLVSRSGAAPALDTAASAFLPATVKGATASGAGYGYAMPTVEGESPWTNAGFGAGGGWLGAGAPRAVSWLGQQGRSLSPAMSGRAQERAAAGALERFASDPAALRVSLARNQQIVPGSMPTTAEATGDIGLAGLQRTLANTPEFNNPLTALRESNNAARVSRIEGAFGGANAASADAVRNARDLAARQTLRPIGNVSVSDTAPISTAVARLIEKNKASGTITGVLQDVQAMIPNIKTVQDAHMVRKELAELMGGRIEGKANGKLAQKELMVVRDILDRQMRQAFPDWGKFLREYKGASRELGQINVGEALLDKGPNMRAVGEIPQLSAPKFAGAANNMDRTVQQATGFRRARADTALTPQQLQVVDEVRRDLERYARTDVRGKAVGSNTVQNAIGGNRLQDTVGPVGAAMIEPVSGAALLGLNALRRSYGDKVAAIVNEAMLDPNRAAEILARLPSAQRREIVRKASLLINQSGSTGGRALAPSLE